MTTQLLSTLKKSASQLQDKSGTGNPQPAAACRGGGGGGQHRGTEAVESEVLMSNGLMGSNLF